MVAYSQASDIRKPLSFPGIKEQVKDYQNLERSVTINGWQRRPLNRGCNLFTKHTKQNGPGNTKPSRRELALPGRLMSLPLSKVNEKPKRRGSSDVAL